MKHSNNKAIRGRISQRGGSVMLAVLVIVAVLTLSAYSFTEIMVTETEATVMYGRSVQTRMFADSGLELVAALLGDDPVETEQSFYHDPSMFQNVLITESDFPRNTGRFSIIAPIENDITTSSIRFGLIDESGKLDLNSILDREDSDDPDSQRQTRETLMYLPDMTEYIADAILDWIDEDDNPREFGAESEVYLPDYEAKNGALESLDELLLVEGMTIDLLYGEDTNRNGLLDLNENDGLLSLPDDDEDGILLLGWSVFLTVYGRESNLRSDGTEKINMNHDALDELYDQIEAEFDEDTARFLVAYRLNGAYQDPSTQQQSDSNTNNQSNSNNNSSSGSSQPLQQAAQGVATALFSAGRGGSVTRGGMDLSGGSQYTINSHYDLVGSQVEIDIDDQTTLLESPWPEDESQMLAYLPTMIDSFSTTDEPFIKGRVNISQARLEVLQGIPDMPEGVPELIFSSQAISEDGQVSADSLELRATTGWLLIQRILDLQQIRQLDQYITAGGDVYRAQVLGYFDTGGPFTRLEAIIDATEHPPKIVFLRNLAELGKGFSQTLLTNGM